MGKMGDWEFMVTKFGRLPAAGMPPAATPSASGLQVGDPPQSKSLEATGIMESNSTVGHRLIGNCSWVQLKQ